jgi:hypothetical protein
MTNYNLTNLTGVTDLGGLFTFSNEVTAGNTFGLILIAVWVIMILSLKKYELKYSIVAASFSCALMSLLLAMGGLLSPLYAFFFIAATAGSTLWLFASGDQ